VRDESSLIEHGGNAGAVDHALRTRSQIKKIPLNLRRPKPHFDREPNLLKRTMACLREDPHFFRSAVQLSFVLLCVWIGIEFSSFVRWGMSGGGDGFVRRPPGVEGFLPISALISLKYWLQTGIINNIHPSGLFIFIAIAATGLLLKKAFCSWLCPIGTLSESLWMFGRKIFKRNLSVPRWLDYPLRSLKYVLLLFFAWSIVQMDVPALAAFIHSPYNKVADVKMYLFFVEISTFVLWTLIVLVLLSVVIQNFWCRYLCPYGALLGALSWLSPFKITRTKETCIDCELCTKACPASIKVHTATRVWSDECMSCLECVAVCPVKNTLAMRVSKKSPAVPSWAFGALVIGLFTAITGLAMLTGHWHNEIAKDEYLRRMQNINSPVYQHFRGQAPQYEPND
jgi:Pyruvate/2-oxoacid:ferredoxin oxidoreductase delta subunit